jgi:membrane protein
VGSFTAANLSGFLHGFVLFCSLPLDLGVPFGGFTEIGGMVAVGLWLYLFHVIVLAGYAATLSFSTYLTARDGKPIHHDTEPDRAEDQSGPESAASRQEQPGEPESPDVHTQATRSA